MADPRAFLTTPRRARARRPPQERVQDWAEVDGGRPPLPLVREQASRCMDCGLPFCHNACPLGNLVPDWNALAAGDDWRAAATHLLATDNFPEFTGRLCPAPCESACVLAIDSEAVTIRNIELALADHAWEIGVDRPRPPERRTGRRVAVVGSGPAGLAAAQQLTRAGHTTTVYERADRLGGLLRYGIPPFRLEKHRLDRRLDQLRAEGTRFRTGVDVGRDLPADRLRSDHDAVLLAVGATAPRGLPSPGHDLPGVRHAMDYLTQANRADQGDFPRPPLTAEGRHVVIVGGGDTAADCLGTALRQHAISVTQLDINPRPPDRRAAEQPWPVHPKVYRRTASHEEAGEEPRVFAATTVGFDPGPDGRLAAVRFAHATPGDRRPEAGTERTLPAQLALLALGFTGPEPDSPIAGQLGLAFGPHGALARDAHFATAADGVFVAGDAGRGQSLIVWAIAEGRAAAAAVDHYLRGTTDLPAPVTPADHPLAP